MKRSMSSFLRTITAKLSIKKRVKSKPTIQATVITKRNISDSMTGQGNMTKIDAPEEQQLDTVSHGKMDPKSQLKCADDLPPWFLTYCVKSAADLKNSKGVVVVDRDSPLASAAKNDDPDTYEIESVIYEGLEEIIAERPSKGNENVKLRFTKDVLYLNHSGETGRNFLVAVVESFSRSLEAALITISLDDLKDLCEALYRKDHPTKNPSNGRYLDKYFSTRNLPSEEPEDSDSKCDGDGREEDSSSRKGNGGSRFPFKTVFRSPASTNGPLIVHVPDGHDFRSSIAHSALYHLLRVAGGCKREYGAVLVIISGQCSSADITIGIGRIPSSKHVRLVPVQSNAQKSLLSKHEGECIQNKNMRAIQRKLRHRSSASHNRGLLEPYGAGWQFPAESLTLRNLRDALILEDSLEKIVKLVRGDISIPNIDHVISHIHRRAELFHRWDDRKQQEQRFSELPAKAQEAIAKIRRDEKQYKLENRLFGHIVDSDNIVETWSDIQVDSGIKKAILQMISLPTQNPRLAQGILKRGRINGALLYGPPGTGKTHLARVLARECKSVMIHVSAADVVSKWVGETEKLIQALFNLGKMLAPCTIFIDEADNLFRARRHGDYAHTTSRISQLLIEADGLSRTDESPFLLLATNFPQHLDDAVLRRVPGRLNIDFPTCLARKNIFGISLKEERLDLDVNLDLLASSTDWHTGSDIRSICIQAALIAEDERLEAGIHDHQRVLRAQHFTQAMTRIGLTVSGDILRAIRDFAKEFDPHAVSKMRIETGDALDK